ncbi:hypothetical protein [Jeotgalibaca porci]|uniref:hypothetical protein n=1 Tax=Jeotgalibaca porci TaxID=1868793 RepID=UPI0035A05BF7
MSWAEDMGIDCISSPEDIVMMEKFWEYERKRFIEHMSKETFELQKRLIRKEIEPNRKSRHPMKAQEIRYFTHVNIQGELVDVRTIDANYARNLHKWYAASGFSEDSLYMKTLKDLSETSAEEDFKNL